MSAQAGDWVPLDAFIRDEGLTSSDLVRMALARPRLLPRVCELKGRIWVHAPTIGDWRALIGARDFVREADHV